MRALLSSIINLCLGFAIGQGTFFVSQTVLLLRDDLSVLANVGMIVSLLSISQWLADAGNNYVTQIMFSGKQPARAISNYVVARLIFVSSLIVLGLLMLLLFRPELPSVVSVTLPWMPLVMILSCFNLSGILDLTRNTKVSGPASQLAWFFSAIGIFLSLLTGSNLEGFLPFFYFIGFTAFIILQINELLKYDFLAMRLDYISLSGLGESFALIFGYTSMFGVAQGFARGLIFYIENALGSVAAGSYFYARTVVNIVNQLISFARRIEFKQYLDDRNQRSIKNILVKNTVSFIFGVAAVIVMGAGGAFFNFALYFPENVETVYWITVGLMSANMLWILASSFSQYFVSQRKFYTVAILQAISIVMFFTAPAILGWSFITIGNLILLEGCMYGVQLCLFVLLIRWSFRRAPGYL